MPDKAQTRVVIVEDHPMVREHLSHLISMESDMVVCGEADNIQQARQIIEKLRPDIALVDITLRGSSGLELIKDLKALGIGVPILVVSMHDEAVYAERALRAGARGYITKSEASEEVMNAIRQVLAGGVYASPTFTSQVLQNLVETGKPRHALPLNQLSDRELEVFHLIGHGRTTQEIAMTLNLGASTVDSYKARVKEKLHLKNAAELSHQAANWVRDLEQRTAEPSSEGTGKGK